MKNSQLVPGGFTEEGQNVDTKAALTVASKKAQSIREGDTGQNRHCHSHCWPVRNGTRTSWVKAEGFPL